MVNCSGLELDGYKLPEFELRGGYFLRMWIRTNPLPNTTAKRYTVFVKRLNSIFSGKEKVMAIKPEQHFTAVKPIKDGFLTKLLFPKSIGQYLNKRGIKLNPSVITELAEFGLTPNEKIKTVDFRKLKLLEIHLSFKISNHVVFDYYGLGPVEEKILTKYAKQQVTLGKTCIGLDRLECISDLDTDSKIINIQIEQVIFSPDTK